MHWMRDLLIDSEPLHVVGHKGDYRMRYALDWRGDIIRTEEWDGVRVWLQEVGTGLPLRVTTNEIVEVLAVFA